MTNEHDGNRDAVSRFVVTTDSIVRDQLRYKYDRGNHNIIFKLTFIIQASIRGAFLSTE